MYGPSDIEAKSGWKGDALRDLRRKQYLGSYGTLQENGRWSYSRRDIVGFWVASILHDKDRQADLRTIFGLANSVADELVKHFEGRTGRRWHACLHHRKSIGGGATLSGSELRCVDSLDGLQGFYSVEALDLLQLSKLAHDGIRAMFE